VRNGNEGGLHCIAWRLDDALNLTVVHTWRDTRRRPDIAA